jgi:hypothetical protein
MEIDLGKEKIVVKLAGGGTAKVSCNPKTGIIRKTEHDYNSTGTIFMQGTEYPLTIKSFHSVLVTAKN